MLTCLIEGLYTRLEGGKGKDQARCSQVWNTCGMALWLHYLSEEVGESGTCDKEDARAVGELGLTVVPRNDQARSRPLLHKKAHNRSVSMSVHGAWVSMQKELKPMICQENYDIIAIAGVLHWVTTGSSEGTVPGEVMGWSYVLVKLLIVLSMMMTVMIRLNAGG